MNPFANHTVVQTLGDWRLNTQLNQPTQREENIDSQLPPDNFDQTIKTPDTTLTNMNTSKTSIVDEIDPLDALMELNSSLSAQKTPSRTSLSTSYRDQNNSDTESENSIPTDGGEQYAEDETFKDKAANDNLHDLLQKLSQFQSRRPIGSLADVPIPKRTSTGPLSSLVNPDQNASLLNDDSKLEDCTKLMNNLRVTPKSSNTNILPTSSGKKDNKSKLNIDEHPEVTSMKNQLNNKILIMKQKQMTLRELLINIDNISKEAEGMIRPDGQLANEYIGHVDYINELKEKLDVSVSKTDILRQEIELIQQNIVELQNDIKDRVSQGLKRTPVSKVQPTQKDTPIPNNLNKSGTPRPSGTILPLSQSKSSTPIDGKESNSVDMSNSKNQFVDVNEFNKKKGKKPKKSTGQNPGDSKVSEKDPFLIDEIFIATQQNKETMSSTSLQSISNVSQSLSNVTINSQNDSTLVDQNQTLEDDDKDIQQPETVKQPKGKLSRVNLQEEFDSSDDDSENESSDQDEDVDDEYAKTAKVSGASKISSKGNTDHQKMNEARKAVAKIPFPLNFQGMASLDYIYFFGLNKPEFIQFVEKHGKDMKKVKDEIGKILSKSSETILRVNWSSNIKRVEILKMFKRLAKLIQPLDNELYEILVHYSIDVNIPHQNLCVVLVASYLLPYNVTKILNLPQVFEMIVSVTLGSLESVVNTLMRDSRDIVNRLNSLLPIAGINAVIPLIKERERIDDHREAYAELEKKKVDFDLPVTTGPIIFPRRIHTEQEIAESKKFSSNINRADFQSTSKIMLKTIQNFTMKLYFDNNRFVKGLTLRGITNQNKVAILTAFGENGYDFTFMMLSATNEDVFKQLIQNVLIKPLKKNISTKELLLEINGRYSDMFKGCPVEGTEDVEYSLTQ